jgi:hypothetical protein
MTDPALHLPPEASPTERRSQIEQRAVIQGQPTTLAGWRALLGPLPPTEEGEASLEAFEEALNDIRKRPARAPAL